MSKEAAVSIVTPLNAPPARIEFPSGKINRGNKRVAFIFGSERKEKNH